MDSITVDFDVRVPMRDGVSLSADVFHPSGDGPFPVLLARTPYGKADLSELFYLDPWTAVRSGFIVVLQDVRGRGLSEGDAWTPLAQEARDGYDTIEWAAALPSSNGRVGMWGASYLGNVQLQAALEHPPSLKAIVPMFTWNSTADGLVARGGVKELGLCRSWSLFMALEEATRQLADDDAAMAERMRELMSAIDGIPGATNEALPTRPDRIIDALGLPDLADPAAVAASDMTGRLGSIRVPSLHIGGWFDVFLQGTLDNYTECRDGAGAQLLVGPWNHMHYRAIQGEVNFGFAANHFAIEYRSTLFGLVFEWLHAQLSGSPDSVDQPSVLVYLMGANKWLREETWPPPGVSDTQWHFDGDGGLATTLPAPASVSFVHRPYSPVPTTGGATLLDHQPAGSYAQGDVEDRDDVLLFTSETLEEQLDVVGRVSATLRVSSGATSADWVVRLCDVHPDGTSFNVTDGIVRVDGIPGEESTVRVDLWSTAMSFKAGHRLRVQIAASGFPRWERNTISVDEASGVDPQAAQTLYLGPEGCHLTLPLRKPAVPHGATED